MDAACLSVIPERWAKRVDDSRGSHTAVSMGLSLGGGSTVSPLCLGGLVMCLPSSSVQANSRYPQSELLKQQALLSNTLQWDDWLDILRVSYDLIVEPQANYLPQPPPPHTLQSYTTSPQHASIDLGRKMKTSRACTTAPIQRSPSTWVAMSAPALTRTFKTFAGVGVPLPAQGRLIQPRVAILFSGSLILQWSSLLIPPL